MSNLNQSHISKHVPFADWSIKMGDIDLTPRLNPHLISATLRETRDKEADELSIELIDENGLIELPPRGRIIDVKIGWQRGDGVPIGLIPKGQFKIDEISLKGVNGTISIIARSADFAGDFRTRRNHSYIGKTLAQILGEIAARNNYELQIDNELGGLSVPSLIRFNISDAQVLSELAKRFSAQSGIKNNKLLFAKIGGGKSAKGTQLPIIEISVNEIEPRSLSFTAADRENANGTEAEWHDRQAGQRKLVQHDTGAGNVRPKRLKRVYHNENEAKAAAIAAQTESKRAKLICEIDLPLGRADLFPNFNIKLSGFKDIINKENWAIDTIETTMGANGLKSKLTLENY